MSVNNTRFGGFVVTYNRPGILGETLNKLMSQSFPPSLILIIDNSESDETQQFFHDHPQPSVTYHRMDSNVGPSGAAAFGLKKLADLGFEWIFWGDDDNPPDFSDSFEILFRTIESQQVDPGMVGSVGQYFNRKWGEIRRVADHELRSFASLRVDSIAGGQCLIVSRKVVLSGVIPVADLFFGFEELDFCLRARERGYSLYVSTELFMRARQKYNKLDFRKPLLPKRNNQALHRQYYSIRNLLTILYWHRLYVAMCYQFLKSLIKMLYGFRYGTAYGARNAGVIYHGVMDFLRGRLGKRDIH